MAQNPVAIVTSVQDVVVMPDASHIVITLDVGGPKVDLALEPDLALHLVDACAQGYADSRDIKKVPKEARTLFPATGFELGQNDRRSVVGLTVTFGRGGHLSFALDNGMANSLLQRSCALQSLANIRKVAIDASSLPIKPQFDILPRIVS